MSPGGDAVAENENTAKYKQEAQTSELFRVGFTRLYRFAIYALPFLSTVSPSPRKHRQKCFLLLLPFFSGQRFGLLAPLFFGDPIAQTQLVLE